MTQNVFISEGKRKGFQLHGLSRFKKRFWSRVEKTPTCWIWHGERDKNGYGKAFFNYKNHMAHRIVLFLMNETMPPADKLVLHKCDNTSCVRPDHLYLGTQKDNMADKFRRGRANVAIGERAGNSILTTSMVKQIRKMTTTGSRPSLRVLSTQFGVAPSTICDILKNRTWRHVK